MPTCNCFRTFDQVARKIVYTTWAEIWEPWIACHDALSFASGIMARSAGISTFCSCYVIYYMYSQNWLNRFSCLKYKGFSNRDITILSMNKAQKYLRCWVQIYCGCSASITFYEWNSISIIWPSRARLQRSILWTQFSTTLAHITTVTLAISRWMLSLRSPRLLKWMWSLVFQAIFLFQNENSYL